MFNWKARYEAKSTPWDLAREHPELERRLAARELGPPATVYVPGCGRGHDALALARAGFRVTAVDSVDVVELGEGSKLEELGRLGSSFRVADALAFETEPVALVFDHTFFCALPLEKRPEWGAMVRRVLTQGGRLFALVFPFERPTDLGGPPFAMSAGDLADALGAAFRLCVDEPVEQPGPGRRWKERWAVFERVGP